MLHFEYPDCTGDSYPFSKTFGISLRSIHTSKGCHKRVTELSQPKIYLANTTPGSVNKVTTHNPPQVPVLYVHNKAADLIQFPGIL